MEASGTSTVGTMAWAWDTAIKLTTVIERIVFFIRLVIEILVKTCCNFDAIYLHLFLYAYLDATYGFNKFSDTTIGWK